MPQLTQPSCCFTDQDAVSLAAPRKNVVLPKTQRRKALPPGKTARRAKTSSVRNSLGSWLKKIEKARNATVETKSPTRTKSHPDGGTDQRTQDMRSKKASPYHRLTKEKARHQSAKSRIKPKERPLRPPRDVDKPLPALPLEDPEGHDTQMQTYAPVNLAHRSCPLSHPKPQALQHWKWLRPTTQRMPSAIQMQASSRQTGPPLPPYTVPPCTRLTTASLRKTASMLASYTQLPLGQRIDPRVARQLRMQVRKFRGRSRQTQYKQDDFWTALPLLGWELKWLTYTMALFTETERDKARLHASKDIDEVVAVLKKRGVDNACLTIWEACAMVKRLEVDANGRIVMFGELGAKRDTDMLRGRTLRFAGLRDVKNKDTSQRERIREAIERDIVRENQTLRAKMQRNSRLESLMRESEPPRRDEDATKLEGSNQTLEHEIISLLTKQEDMENRCRTVKDGILADNITARKGNDYVQSSDTLMKNHNEIEDMGISGETYALYPNTEHPGQDHDVCDVSGADVKSTSGNAPNMETSAEEQDSSDPASNKTSLKLVSRSLQSREIKALDKTTYASELGNEKDDENCDHNDVEATHCSLTPDTGSSLDSDPLDLEVEQGQSLSVRDRVLVDGNADHDGLTKFGSGLLVEQLEYEAAVQVRGMKERAAGAFWDIRNEKGEV